MNSSNQVKSVVRIHGQQYLYKWSLTALRDKQGPVSGKVNS